MAGFRSLRRLFPGQRSAEEDEEVQDGPRLPLPTLVYRNRPIEELRKVLERHNCSVNERDGFRNTALHQAIRCMNCQAAKLLLEYNADRSFTNKEGLTPLMLAVLVPVCDPEERCEVTRALLCDDDEATLATLLHTNPLNKYTVFHYLARQGRADMLKVIVERLESILGSKEEQSRWIDQRTGYEGPNAVHLAAAHDHVDVLKQLLDAGGGIDNIDDRDCTPLHYAAECGSHAAVDFILKHATDYGKDTASLLMKEDASGRVPYHSATSNGHLQCLKALLRVCVEEDTDLMVTDNQGRTILGMSCKMGHKIIAEWLLTDSIVGPTIREQLEHSDGDGRTPFHLAAMYGHTDIVKLLTKQGANASTLMPCGTTPLMTVAEFCPPETARSMINVLLRAGVSATARDYKNRTALHATVRNNQSRVGGFIARRLLRSAQTTNEKRALCEAQDINGWSVLHIAAKRGHIGVVNALLTLKTGNESLQQLLDMESVTHQGRNVIHLAAEFGRSRIIRRIVRTLSNHLMLRLVNKQDSSGLTPCHLAAINNHVSVLEQLLESGASPDSTDRNRCTPLHYAAERGSSRIAEILLRYAPGMVNAMDLEESTPLFVACANGHGALVRLLLAHGAEFIANREDLSPLDKAAGSGHTEIVRELLNSCNWRYLLNMSSSLVADTILAKTPRAMNALLDKYAVPGKEIDGKETVVYHLYYLYYNQCPEEFVELITEEDNQIQEAKSPTSGHEHEASRYKASSPMERPALSAQQSMSGFTFDDPTVNGVQQQKSVTVKRSRSHSMPLSLPVRTQRSSSWRPKQQESTTAVSRPSRLTVTSPDSSIDLGSVNTNSSGYTDFGDFTDFSGAENDTDGAYTTGDESDTGAAVTPMSNHSDTSSLSNASAELCLWAMEKEATVRNSSSLPQSTSRDFAGRDATAAALEPTKPTGNTKDDQMDEVDFYDDDDLDDLGGACLDLTGNITIIDKLDRRLSILEEGDEEIDSPSPMGQEAAPAEERRGSTPSMVRLDSVAESPTETLRRYTEKDTTCFGTEPCLVEAILKSGNHSLVLHPVIKEWTRTKWNGYVRNLNYFYFFICTVFLTLLLTFVVIHKNHLESERAAHLHSPGKPNDSCAKDGCEPFVSTRQLLLDGRLPTLRCWLLLMCAVLVLWEISQWWRMRKRYFYYASNYLQWAIVIPTIALVLPVADHPLPWQWLSGSMAVYLCWINIILCVQWSTPLGIYVTMFFHILSSALRAMVLVMLFIVAFGFTFYILLSNKDSFSTIGLSMMKTVGMTVGEIELAETFLTLGDARNNPSEFAGYEQSHLVTKYFIVLLFILILPIIIQSQLIGMAAGDAADVKHTAVIQLATYQVQTVLEWEFSMPTSILARVSQSPVVTQVKADSSSWMVWLTQVLTGVDVMDQSDRSPSPEIAEVMDKLEQLEDLTRTVVSCLDSQQLVLDSQSHRLERIVAKQRKAERLRSFISRDSEPSLDKSKI